jgi:hypothetical protein
VGDCDDLDLIAANPVHEAEGKTRKDVPSGTTSLTRPGERVVGDGSDGVREFLTEGFCRSRVSDGVPVMGRFCLLRGRRVKPDCCRGHSAPVRSGSNLFPGDGLDRAGVQLGHATFNLDSPCFVDAFLDLGVQSLDQEPD